MKNLYKIQDKLYIVSDKEKSSYCIKECPMAGLNIDRCDCQIFTVCSNKVGNIILTTNALLINDGIQAIDDEFLEWFVKNPNCDFVRTLKVPYFDESGHSYVLIIPKEEEFELVSIGEETIKLAIPMMQDKEDTKQETLEEAAERLYPTTINSFTDSGFDTSETERLIFKNGAKWQQEQIKNMYSEEEVRKMFSKYNEVIAHRDIEEWQPWIDKQFKKNKWKKY